MPAQGTPAQRFQYDPNKPVEGQLQTFLAGRNPFGTMGNSDWQNVYNPQYYSSSMSAPDESGTTNQQFQSRDPRVEYHPGADSPYIIDGQYGAVAWKPTTDTNGIRVPGQATPDTAWGGAQPAQDSYVKPDNMYDYNNLYYDPTYGLVRDARDYRDPQARMNAYWDTGIMSVVGGIGGGAAAAANAAAGGASFMGMQAPTIARTGLSAISTMQGARNGVNTDAARPGADARTNYGGNMAVTNSPFGANTSMPTTAAGLSGNPTNSSTTQGDEGDIWGTLGNLLTTGATGYANNQNNQNYRGDISNMMSIGTGGVQNSDRAGARDLVRGIYDGSISGDQIFNRVPGLRDISDRGAADIGRQMAAHGDADPQSSARMREFVKFNNDLTSKAYGSEMDRAMKVGGYNIDPSAMAGQGMRAIGDIYGNNRQDLSALGSLLSSGRAGGTSAGGTAGSLLRSIFGGSSGSGSNSITGGLSSLARALGLGGDSGGSGIDWSGTNGYYEPGTSDYINQQTDPWLMTDPTQGMNYDPPMPDLGNYDLGFDPSSWGMA